MILPLFKRSTIYFFGLTLSKVLSVLVFILFARVLLPEKFGNFTLFVTLLQVITFFADFGLNLWYQKKAGDGEDRQILFSKIISARIFTLFLSILISITFLYLTSSFQFLISVIFLLTLIPEAFLSVIDGYYLEKNQSFKVALKTTSRMFILFTGYLIFINNFSFQLSTQLYLLSSILTLLWFFPKNKWQKINLQIKNIIPTLKSSSSYAFLIMTSFAYARGDSLVIRYTLNSAALGIYGAAYRYLETLSLLPTAISQNLFPISAKKIGISLSQLLKITAIISLIGVLFSVIVYFGSEWLIVGLLGPAYSTAIPILQIFSFVLLLFFISSPLATVVQSSRYVSKFLPFGIINTLLNIILNIIFVPKFGIIAASWIMLLTEITGLLINIYFVKKVYETKN